MIKKIVSLIDYHIPHYDLFKQKKTISSSTKFFKKKRKGKKKRNKNSNSLIINNNYDFKNSKSHPIDMALHLKPTTL